jgi:hypothetical protein
VADALHTPGVVVSAAEARLDDAGLIALQGPTALDIRTGVMVGPGATALVTGTGSTAPMQYAIAPHHWITSRGVNTDGVYRGANETTQLVDTTAAPGSGSRIDVIYEKQGDAASTISPDATTAPVYGVVQGAATTGTPVKPAIPVGAIELATGTVASGATATNGAGVTISNTARVTTTRGGLILCRTQAERLALTTYPTLQAIELDTLRRLWHDGTRWRYEGDRVTVADNTARNALTAYQGLAAYVQSTRSQWLHDGTTWVDPAPMARVRRVAAFNVPNSAFTPIAWDTADFDTTGSPGTMWVAATPTFLTVPRDGYYRVAAGVDTSATATAGRSIISIYRATAAVPGTFTAVNIGRVLPRGSVADAGVDAQGLLKCTAGDMIQAQVFQDSGAAVNTGSPAFGPTYLEVEYRRPL